MCNLGKILHHSMLEPLEQHGNGHGGSLFSFLDLSSRLEALARHSVSPFPQNCAGPQQVVALPQFHVNYDLPHLFS